MRECKHCYEVGWMQQGSRRMTGVERKVSHVCFVILNFSLHFRVCSGAVGRGRPGGWWRVHRVKELG